MPCAAIANSTVIRPAVRHRSLNRGANSLQVIWEIAGIQTGLNRHHAATDVHANSGRDDRTFGRDHTSNGCADSPMNVGHRSDPFEDERKLRRIQRLKDLLPVPAATIRGETCLWLYPVELS